MRLTLILLDTNCQNHRPKCAFVVDAERETYKRHFWYFHRITSTRTMSVVIETTIGDITVDLFLKERPRACQNFLKLCKLKYYNFNLFHTIERGFIAQTGGKRAASFVLAAFDISLIDFFFKFV